MSSTYLPWRPRSNSASPKSARAVAAVASGAARAAKPLLRRPALVFWAAVVLAGLAIWWAGWKAAGGSGAGGGLSAGLLRDGLAILGLVGFVSVLAMAAIWGERKVAAFIQSRLGPTRVGGWHGWAQSLADGIKLLGKEDLIPARADRALFRLAPYFAFVPAVLAFVALPFGVDWVFRASDLGLLLVVAMLGLEVLGVLLAGWASNSKWSMLGGLRQAAQVIAYEIPLGLALLVPVLTVGSLRLDGSGAGFATAQQAGWFSWLAFHSPWTLAAMGIYFTAALAACKRAPFDLPEAESELVAGYHTEYSGFRWSLFFFAEYAAMFVVSGLAVLLFLGGWYAPWSGLMPESLRVPTSPGEHLLSGLLVGGPLWFVGKCLLLVWVQMWLRWTLPRPRIDQVLFLCVQVLLPLALLVLLGATLWELAVRSSPTWGAVATGVSRALALGGLAIGLWILAIIAGGLLRRRALIGRLAVERPRAGA